MRLLALAATSFLLAGCGLLQATQPTISLQAKLDTPDGVVGVFRDARGIHLVLGDQDTGAQDAGDAPYLVRLFSTSGETGRTYNSFVFGLAPPDASQVELAGLQAIGGAVTDRLYVLAIRTKDVIPGQLNWSFMSPAGGVIAHGSNITP